MRIVIFTGLLLAAVPVAALPFGMGGPSGPAAIELVPAELPGRAAALTKVTSEKSLAGVKRVAIGQFQVEYVKRALGLEQKERNQTTVTYEIATPLAQTALQAKTDMLYKAFVDQLVAAGFEVVPRETMQASPAWTKIAGIAKPSPAEISTQSGKGLITNAFGDPYYYAVPDAHLGSMGSMNWGFTMGMMKEQALATELGAAVVDVRMVVGFQETDKHNDLFALMRTGSSFAGKPRLIAQAVATGMTVTTPKGTATITLNSDLMFAGETLSANMKMDTSGVQEASNIAAKGMFAMRVLGGIVPGAGSLPAMKLNTAYKVACSPAETDYLNDVATNLPAVSGMLVARLAAAPR